jgi:hypothetical protein
MTAAGATSGPQVTVVIPTLAAAERAHLLARAVDSIRSSSRAPIRIIAVVNGNRSDAAVCAWLKAQPDVRCEFLEVGSAPLAQLRGRELVETPYFSFLDDDDEYLAGATDLKLARLDENPQAALVVTNGYSVHDGRESLLYSSLEEVTRDPLVALFHENWLHNCNALFRSSHVPVDYFRDPHPYCEWTWLAYRLAIDGKQVVTVKQGCFRYHDSPGSVSKSDAYLAALIPLFRRMLALSPPPTVRRLIGRRLGSTHHTLSSRALASGDWLDAWHSHVRSLVTPSGWRYLTYTRHLLVPPRTPEPAPART